MKKILIPTDFSRHSLNATRVAMELLQSTNAPCHVDLLNTYVVLQDDPVMAITVNDKLKKQSRSLLISHAAEVSKLSQDRPITFDILSKMGTLKNVIGQLLKKEKYDFIVMGKDGGKHVEEVSEVLKATGGCPLIVTFTSS